MYPGERDVKIEVKKNTKKFNEFAVKMTLTEGALLAMKHSLEYGAQAGSAISADLLSFLKPAMESAGIKL